MEQQDEAKAMAQMVNACKCVTIRDAQLAERKYMMLEEEAENRRLDVIMEKERLKALDNYTERDRQRKEERMHGAKVHIALQFTLSLRHVTCTACTPAKGSKTQHPHTALSGKVPAYSLADQSISTRGSAKCIWKVKHWLATHNTWKYWLSCLTLR